MKVLLSKLFKYLKKKRMTMIMNILKANFHFVSSIHETSANNNILERALVKLSKNVNKITLNNDVSDIVDHYNKIMKKKGSINTIVIIT